MASNKPTLLFIHGFRGSDAGLQQIADGLSDYQTFLPKLPPADGQSLLKYNADRYAEWIASYITKQKLIRPILIGHSMGSIISAAVAQKYPQLINDKIVFLSPISTKPNPLFAAVSPLSAILPNNVVDYISTKFLIVPKDKNLFSQIINITHQCSSEYKSKNEVFKTARFSVKHCVGDFNFDKEALIIAGETDRLIPKNKTAILADKIQAQTVFLAGAGHLLNYEQPEATTQAIRQFLASAE